MWAGHTGNPTPHATSSAPTNLDSGAGPSHAPTMFKPTHLDSARRVFNLKPSKSRSSQEQQQQQQQQQ
eukprot:1157775-Pelagomonas_calceolata.AAC.13